MITNEQILEIASQHLYCNMSVVEWSGKSEDILKFARAIYEMGNENGWESREEAEYFNSSYPTGPTGLVGDPQ
jgi:hypothetical protein